MLKSSFTAILILTLCMACVIQAAVLQDDPYTFGLWHGDSVGTTTPDDRTIMGNDRTNRPLTLSGGVALTASGQYDGALDYPMGGGGKGSVTGWSINTTTGVGQEGVMDAWFYLTDHSSLPIATAAGGSGAAAIYAFMIDNGSDSSGVLTLKVMNTVSGPYTVADFQAKQVFLAQTLKVPVYRFITATNLPPTDSNALDLTGRWLHVVVTSQWAATTPSWDPNYSRFVLTVTDPSTATTYTKQYLPNTRLSGSGTTVTLGGNKSASPARGMRGRIDEAMLRTRVHAAMFAYGPTPANGATVSPNANLPVSWHMAAPYNPADTVYQDVWKGSNATFNKTDPNWVKVASNVAGNSTTIGSVVFGNTYYWVVDSNDSGTLVSTPSTTWSFNVNDIAPTVDVGADQVTYLVAGTRTLSFAPVVTDPDTDLGLLTYQWTQLAGPTAAIVSPTSKNTNITFTSAGSCFFQLAAFDGTFSGSDIVRVQVYGTPCAAAQATPGYNAKSTDFNNDCKVNFLDFASFAANWVRCNSLDPACL